MVCFSCNTVQQLLPIQSEHMAKFRDLERKYSSGGVLLQALSIVKDTMKFEVPKHILPIVKARHFLAREDYAMAAIYARRSIRWAPSLATGWCYLAEILAKQTKCNNNKNDNNNNNNSYNNNYNFNNNFLIVSRPI